MLPRHRMLMDLAERKLGKDATIRVTREEGWVAEQGRTRVISKTREGLERALKRMPDVEQQKERVG